MKHHLLVLLSLGVLFVARETHAQAAAPGITVVAADLQKNVTALRQQILVLNHRMTAAYDLMPPKAQADITKFAKFQVMLDKELAGLSVSSPDAVFDALQKKLKVYGELAPKFEKACALAEKLMQQALAAQEQVVPVRQLSDADRQELLLMDIDSKLGAMRRDQMMQQFSAPLLR